MVYACQESDENGNKVFEFGASKAPLTTTPCQADEEATELKKKKKNKKRNKKKKQSNQHKDTEPQITNYMQQEGEKEPAEKKEA